MVIQKKFRSIKLKGRKRLLLKWKHSYLYAGSLSGFSPQVFKMAGDQE